MDYRFGPFVEDDATTFRLFAPSAKEPLLLLEDRKPIPLKRADDGFWTERVEGVGPGASYRFRAGKLEFPDLAARQQDGDSAGWSIVRRPLPAAGGAEIRPWYESVICEVHVGTATPEGTFNALRERLEHFRDAGYTCVELMPLNTFPGTRNWGYDGTLIFAPASTYGTPEELRALVDRAHQLGLSMIADVVYNHFGGTDNFASTYAPEFFDPAIETPWGPGICIDHPAVRQFFYENAVMWLTDYDFDGLRLDAVHEIKSDATDQFLGELAETARAAKPHAKLIIENVRNSFRWLERTIDDQPLRYCAQWNDDMHSVLTYLATGEGRRTGYDDPKKVRSPISRRRSPTASSTTPPRETAAMAAPAAAMRRNSHPTASSLMCRTTTRSATAPTQRASPSALSRRRSISCIS